MTAMGQRLQAGETLYSAWFPRGGDYAVFRAQLIDKAGADSPEITIKVFHKNKEDAGDGSVLQVGGSTDVEIDLTDGLTDGTIVSADTGNFSSSEAPLKELVRLKFACTGSWMRFQMLQPVWYNKARV
jgi:hypothetical protein